MLTFLLAAAVHALPAAAADEWRKRVEDVMARGMDAQKAGDSDQALAHYQSALALLVENEQGESKEAGVLFTPDYQAKIDIPGKDASFIAMSRVVVPALLRVVEIQLEIWKDHYGTKADEIPASPSATRMFFGLASELLVLLDNK